MFTTFDLHAVEHKIVAHHPVASLNAGLKRWNEWNQSSDQHDLAHLQHCDRALALNVVL